LALAFGVAAPGDFSYTTVFNDCWNND